MILHIKKYIWPIIIGVLVIYFGLFFSNHAGLYASIPELDSVYHFLGGVVLGWFFYRYFTGSTFRMTKLNLVFVTVAAACFIGVFWEFAERLSSIYSPIYFPWLYDYFHGGDLGDTLFDLVCDMSGALVFVVLSLTARRNR